jgi:hypothetical protein
MKMVIVFASGVVLGAIVTIMGGAAAVFIYPGRHDPFLQLFGDPVQKPIAEEQQAMPPIAQVIPAQVIPGPEGGVPVPPPLQPIPQVVPQDVPPFGGPQPKPQVVPQKIPEIKKTLF